MPTPPAETAQGRDQDQGRDQGRPAAGTGTGRRRRAPGAEGAYPQDPAVQDGYARERGAAQGQRTGYAQGVGPGVYGQAPSGYGQRPAPAGRPVWDTPMHGTPVYTAPTDGAVRGGHPEHPETRTGSARDGAWQGPRRDAQAESAQAEGAQAEGAQTRTAQTRTAPAESAQARTAPAGGADAPPPLIPGQRRESDADDVPEELPEEAPAKAGGKGRTFTGIAAAAVTTVLAVVVAGQVAEGEPGGAVAHSAEGPTDRAVENGGTSRSDDRLTPANPPPAPAEAVLPPTYEQLLALQFPIDPELKGSGEFEAVAGLDKAPGKGRKIRYRVDVEKGLGLDSKLFARAVQQTLNDPRSWAGRGAMTFERISGGEPEFVVTLASPGTTGTWCAKSGLDTTVDNVSCDSAATSRVMINAFRWAQGSDTFGDKAMVAYRQMLINHEVGHRLGHGHVTCRTPGALAPVMQQQTKSLDIDGIKCRPNPWVHPGS
ncbi:DUF3152 domain-containing protein [Streptomyces sp. NPDC090127]|uniref:DUF3152 domain-containing protein n=1 Tax=Streptomyces sp. NPDC090127 TaxID=3365953 RepID=UPI0037FF8DF8